MNISKLRFPPIKYNPLNTDFFVYKTIRHSVVKDYCRYYAFNRKGRKLAIMEGFPEKNTEILRHYLPIQKLGPSFYIHYLLVSFPRMGIGSKLLNIAEKESYRMGCNGRLHLISSSSFMPSKPPHPFYRKNGFSTTFSSKLKAIDKCIYAKQDFKTNNSTEEIKMFRIPEWTPGILNKFKKLNSEANHFGIKKIVIKFKNLFDDDIH